MYHSIRKARKKRGKAAWLVLVLVLAAWVALRGMYIVVDGERIMTDYGFGTSSQEILERTGIVLEPLDGTRQSRKLGVTILTVERAPRVTLRYRGTAQIVTTSGETVAQLLKRLGKMPEEGDTVSLPGDTRLEDGMTIAIDQVQYRQEVYTVVQPCATEYRQDASAPWGEETVLKPGVEGEARVTAQVEYTNGRETGRTVVSQQEVIPAQPRVVLVGTGEWAVEVHDRYLTLPDGQMLPFSKTLVVEATAYTGTDPGCNPVTATGTKVHRGTVCVDPNFIPYGTRMFILSSDGSYVYGIGQAEDCREGMEGYRIDLYLSTPQECAEFDRRSCTVFVLG